MYVRILVYFNMINVVSLIKAWVDMEKLHLPVLGFDSLSSILLEGFLPACCRTVRTEKKSWDLSKAILNK